MLHKVILTVITLVCLATTPTVWAYNADYNQHQNVHWTYPLVLTVGTIAGVAAANVFTYGAVGAIPYWTGTAATPVLTPAAMATGRMIFVGSGVLGSLVADLLYTSATH
ncbi:hypothetical protein TI04_02515 [Achromatium sp. WMS2]|nr:hypothetical protein TI04_02515 [Achromatium sp. WMS2]